MELLSSAVTDHPLCITSASYYLCLVRNVYTCIIEKIGRLVLLSTRYGSQHIGESLLKTVPKV